MNQWPRKHLFLGYHQETPTCIESLTFEQLEMRHVTIRTAHIKTCQWLLRAKNEKWLDKDQFARQRGFIWIKENRERALNAHEVHRQADYSQHAGSDSVVVLHVRREALETRL